MIGTPEEIIDGCRHYEALGVTEFSVWSDNSLTHEEKKRSLELFIEHVVPAFQEQKAAVRADTADQVSQGEKIAQARWRPLPSAAPARR